MFTHKLNDEAELKLLERRDTQELYALVDRNREHLRRFLPWVDETKTVDDIRNFISRQLHQHADDGTIAAGIWFQGAIAGVIGIECTGIKCMEIGYWLGEEYQGKGLMTAACKAIIHHAFADMGMNRIEIRVEPENNRSRAIPERLGFTCEGTMRAKGMNADGKFIDLMMFSQLKSEWQAQNYES